jgi:homoserine dehydrogenase
MSSVAALETRADVRAAAQTSALINIALLGCGNVGSAFAALAADGARRPLRITHALVRDCMRPRQTLDPEAHRIGDGREIFQSRPDVVVELLGGLEPARGLVTEALVRGIPVVTANKSLLAAHGTELREIAARTATPLLYEAAVIAGVPFLGTFARRPYASAVTSLAGIANGTSNYILTRARDVRCGIDLPLREAQHLGYAETDPCKDVDGFDAAEKLAVLLQHFAGVQASTDVLDVTGIRNISSDDIGHAADLGGTIKPVIAADWSGGLCAFVGPAFVPLRHVLASVDGAENAIIFNGPRGRLVFQGPGAGPEVTAATVMDDVVEAVKWWRPNEVPVLRAADPASPETGWMISARGTRLPAAIDIADLLASFGVYLRRTTDAGCERFAALTWPVPSEVIDEALGAVRRSSGCSASRYRTLEA